MTTPTQFSDKVKYVAYDLEFYAFEEGELPDKIRQIAFYDPETDETFFRNVSKTDFPDIWDEATKFVNKGLNGRQLVYVSHNNYQHDNKVLKKVCESYGKIIPYHWIPFDTLYLAGSLLRTRVPGEKTLQALRHKYNIEYIGAHTADSDALITHRVFMAMLGNAPLSEALETIVDNQKNGPVKKVGDLIKRYNVSTEPLAPKVAATAKKVEDTRKKVPIPFLWDTETTGLSFYKDQIIEAAVYTPTRQGKEAWYHTMINPGMKIPEAATKVHHIKDEDVANAKTTKVAMQEMVAFVEGVREEQEKHIKENHGEDVRGVPLMIAHNSNYDKNMLKNGFRKARADFPDHWTFPCTCKVSRVVNKDRPKGFKHALQSLRETYEIPETENAHRAYDDVEVTCQVFKKMIGNADEQVVYQKMLESPDDMEPVGQYIIEANKAAENVEMEEAPVAEIQEQPKRKRRKSTNARLLVDDQDDEGWIPRAKRPKRTLSQTKIVRFATPLEEVVENPQPKQPRKRLKRMG